MSTPLRRIFPLLALFVSCAPLLAQDAPVDLKKWPKNDPIEIVLLKDEKAIYKRLATDDERRQFIDFVYARRSTKAHDFRKVLANIVELLDKKLKLKVEYTNPTTNKKMTVYEAWDTDPGHVALRLGMPDVAETSKDKEETYVFRYTRKLPGPPLPEEFDFKATQQPYMGGAIDVMRYNSSLPPSVWEALLAPAAADWDSYKADPTSVLLKECVPLLPALCQAPAPPKPAADGVPAPEGGDAGEVKMAAGKIADPDFSIEYPESGAIPVGLNVSFLPTQKAGDTEIRIVLAAEGAAFTGKAHLIPGEGSTGSEQDFVETDFKGIVLKGKNYLEARRSVKAGRYLLAVVVLRPGEFGRKTQSLTIPEFTEGKLSIAASMLADKAEPATPGDPLTIGNLRILPRTGKMKPGDMFSIYAVAYGGLSLGGYNFEGELTCHVEFGISPKSKHKVDFGASGVQERVCVKVHSSSPLLGFEEIKIPAPPQPSVKIGNEVVPILTRLYKVKYVIRDVNGGGATVDSGWITIPLE